MNVDIRRETSCLGLVAARAPMQSNAVNAAGAPRMIDIGKALAIAARDF